MTIGGARPGRVGAGMLALVAVWCVGFLAPDVHLALLYLAPALLLATALLAGRYPGERALERIAAQRRRPRPTRSSSTREPRTRPCGTVHGGLLLARALAGRAPPRSRRIARSR